MQVVRSEAVDPKSVALYGSLATFVAVNPNIADKQTNRIQVFVIDTSKGNEKTKVTGASNNLEAKEEPVGAYVEVKAGVLEVDGKPLPPLAPHPGRVFLRQDDGSYKEVHGQDKTSSVSLMIESQDEFPNLHGKVVHAEVFDN